MTRLDPSNAVFVYDGTLEGFLSVVFAAYSQHCAPAHICRDGAVQLGFGQRLNQVATCMSHAQRVRDGMCAYAGADAYKKLRCAYLTDQPGKEDALFAYVARAMERGSRIYADLAHPAVAQVERLVTQVLNERERMYQFLRFEQLEGGVYYACINPNVCVVPLMMQHFIERFRTQPFIIYDEVHMLAGVACDGRSMLVSAEHLDLPDRTADEAAFQALWKRFYDSASNEQRYNPDLRRSLMPKRLWRNITEFKNVL